MQWITDRFTVLGIFDVGFFVDGKLKELKMMNLPSTIDIFVNEVETRNVKLPGYDSDVQCRVITYLPGAKVMRNGIIQDSAKAIYYLSLICGGKIPSIVPYSETSKLWRKNQEINNVNLGVPAVIEELILSAAYRDKNNPTRKFSSVAGKDPKVSEYDYTMASIRQICQWTSTFTGLWFEDFDSMVTTSLNRTREKVEEAESPLEKIIKM